MPQQQRDEQHRYQQRRERDRHEVQQDSDRGDLPEGEGRQWRRGEGGPHRTAEGAHPHRRTDGAITPAGRRTHTRECEHRQPRSHIADRPGIAPEHQQCAGPEQGHSAHMTLPPATPGNQRHQCRCANRGGWPADEGRVSGCGRHRERFAAMTRHTQQSQHQQYPARDHGDVRTRNGQKMHQASGSEGPAERGIDRATSAGDERVHQRGLRSIESDARCRQNCAQ